MITIYYRKCHVRVYDYREYLETNTHLQHCSADGLCTSIETLKTFDSAEKELLDAWQRVCGCQSEPTIAIAQLPSVTIKSNLNPHGLM